MLLISCYKNRVFYCTTYSMVNYELVREDNHPLLIGICCIVAASVEISAPGSYDVPVQNKATVQVDSRGKLW
jgi:hypothetical protein